MIEVEFRDGKRLVPDHLGLLMKGMETHTLTHEQAIEAANRKLVNDRLMDAQNSLISRHRTDFGGD